MINHINLLKEVLDLNDADVQAVLDSQLSVQELVFADGDYLHENKKLNPPLISKLAQLRMLMSEISLQKLKKSSVMKS